MTIFPSVGRVELRVKVKVRSTEVAPVMRDDEVVVRDVR